MSDTKFTPGPWKWSDSELLDSTGAAIIKHEDDGACGDPECCGGGSCWVEVREADKPLIAAAPDLYAALAQGVDCGHGEDCPKRYCGDEECDGTTPEPEDETAREVCMECEGAKCDCLYAKWSAVLAKARGESPAQPKPEHVGKHPPRVKRERDTNAVDLACGPQPKPEACEECHGTGRDALPPDHYEHSRICRSCNGTGKKGIK